MGDAGWTLSFLLNACACGAGGKFFIPGLQNPREHSSSRGYNFTFPGSWRAESTGQHKQAYTHDQLSKLRSNPPTFRS